MPVPVSFDVCGLLLALSLTLNVPFLVPVAVGVKVTLIVHLPWAARLVVHVVVDTAKSPVVEMAMLVRSTLWWLVKLNVFAVLVEPTAHVPKEALSGTSVAGSTPVPASADVCGLLPALSLTLSCPFLVPNTVGVKVALIVHLLWAARLVVHVVADTAKSPVVEMAMLVSAMFW